MTTFWTIFSLSFMVALTGAISPGPLLTYTIVKSVQTKKRGYLTGIWVIAGHALLEAGIIIFLLLGFSFILKNVIIIRIIGTVGGIILIFFGLSILKNIYKNNIRADFLNNFEPEANGNENKNSSGGNKISNPVIGGFLVSMSNPYWWIWWVTIGLAFIVQFEISFGQWLKLAAFFLGHEAGDLVWYLLVSVLSSWGAHRINKKTYYGILAVCGLFMILFGIYLGVSPFMTDTV